MKCCFYDKTLKNITYTLNNKILAPIYSIIPIKITLEIESFIFNNIAYESNELEIQTVGMKRQAIFIFNNSLF